MDVTLLRQLIQLFLGYCHFIQGLHHYYIIPYAQLGYLCGLGQVLPTLGLLHVCGVGSESGEGPSLKAGGCRGKWGGGSPPIGFPRAQCHAVKYIFQVFACAPACAHAHAHAHALPTFIWAGDRHAACATSLPILSESRDG